MKKLFAGSFVGEFGWELFVWQAYIRAMSKDYDYVTVASRPGREFLYKDYADEFVPFTPAPENSVTMWACYDMRPAQLADVCPPPDVTWLDPTVILSKMFNSRKNIEGLGPIEKFTPPDQEFIPFGRKGAHKGFDMVIHARHRTDAKGVPAKNWPDEYYQKLVGHFKDFRIACVGHPQASRNVPGTEDLRGVPLEMLADILANSRLCTSASDGLINFAILCQTPSVIWTPQCDAKKNIDRHTNAWNPFKTPVDVLVHDTWQPPPEVVIPAIEKFLGKLNA